MTDFVLLLVVFIAVFHTAPLKSLSVTVNVIVSEMTYNVSMGTLNPTIPIPL